jgi:hypothetical protein
MAVGHGGLPADPTFTAPGSVPPYGAVNASDHHLPQGAVPLPAIRSNFRILTG